MPNKKNLEIDCEMRECPVTREEIVYMQEKVDMLTHKIFGGENPEESLITNVSRLGENVSEIKDSMDKINRNAWKFLSIFGVFILIGIFNSGMYFKQLNYTEQKVLNLEQELNNIKGG